MGNILGTLGHVARRACRFYNVSGVHVLHKSEWSAMDLLFCRELRFAFFRRSSDCLREVSRLSEWTILHIWSQVGASAFGRILSLGLASVFVRRDFSIMFIVIKALMWSNKSLQATAAAPTSCD
jgi:hypothetical protein